MYFEKVIIQIFQTLFFLVDCVEEDDLIANDSFCLHAVSQAKNSHLLPERKELTKKKQRIRSSDERLFIVGGEIHNYVFNTLDCYNFHEDSWASLACLNKPRDGLGVTTYNGLIFAAGGKCFIRLSKFRASILFKYSCTSSQFPFKIMRFCSYCLKRKTSCRSVVPLHTSICLQKSVQPIKLLSISNLLTLIFFWK